MNEPATVFSSRNSSFVRNLQHRILELFIIFFILNILLRVLLFFHFSDSCVGVDRNLSGRPTFMQNDRKEGPRNKRPHVVTYRCVVRRRSRGVGCAS